MMAAFISLPPLQHGRCVLLRASVRCVSADAALGTPVSGARVCAYVLFCAFPGHCPSQIAHRIAPRPHLNACASANRPFHSLTNKQGFGGTETWLDITNWESFKDVMAARIDAAAADGCTAMEVCFFPFERFSSICGTLGFLGIAFLLAGFLCGWRLLLPLLLRPLGERCLFVRARAFASTFGPLSCILGTIGASLLRSAPTLARRKHTAPTLTPLNFPRNHKNSWTTLTASSTSASPAPARTSSRSTRCSTSGGSHRLCTTRAWSAA